MPWNEPGSGNKDPWGSGNRKGGGQGPDLEDVINNVRKRFGGGGSGKGGLGGFSPVILIVLVTNKPWVPACNLFSGRSIRKSSLIHRK